MCNPRLGSPPSTTTWRVAVDRDGYPQAGLTTLHAARVGYSTADQYRARDAREGGHGVHVTQRERGFGVDNAPNKPNRSSHPVPFRHRLDPVGTQPGIWQSQRESATSAERERKSGCEAAGRLACATPRHERTGAPISHLMRPGPSALRSLPADPKGGWSDGCCDTGRGTGVHGGKSTGPLRPELEGYSGIAPGPAKVKREDGPITGCGCDANGKVREVRQGCHPIAGRHAAPMACLSRQPGPPQKVRPINRTIRK